MPSCLDIMAYMLMPPSTGVIPDIWFNAFGVALGMALFTFSAAVVWLVILGLRRFDAWVLSWTRRFGAVRWRGQR